MKNIQSWLLGVLLGLSLFTISGAAEAYCRYVPAHWQNGYRVSGHEVCRASQVRCRYVEGYWRHGYWHQAHRVCWRVY